MEQKYYLTKKGLAKIQKEYQKLLEAEKDKIYKEGVPSMWYSEEVNPDYLAFQEELQLIEAKLVEYDEVLKNNEIIKPPASAEKNTVHLGARVTVMVDDGQVDEFDIVGTVESNPMQRKISN